MYVKLEAAIKFRDFGVDLGHADKTFQLEVPTTDPIEGFIVREALNLLDGGKPMFTKEVTFNGVDLILSISNDPFDTDTAPVATVVPPKHASS